MWIPYDENQEELAPGRYTVTVETAETGGKEVRELLLRQPALGKRYFYLFEGERVTAYMPKPEAYNGN